MDLHFCVPDSERRSLEARGFRYIEGYNTLRCGQVAVMGAPEGTRDGERVTDAIQVGMSRAYDRKAQYRYVLPDGSTFVAGGGGPSDLDSVRFES